MSATVSGMFFEHLIEHLDRQCGRGTSRRLCAELGIPSAYKQSHLYPVEQLERLRRGAIGILYPGKDLSAGMLALGALGVQSFQRTLVGKVALRTFRKGFKQLVTHLGYLHDKAANFGRVEVTELGERRYRVHHEGFREYPEIHQGMLRAALEALGHQGTIELTVLHFEDRGDGHVEADFDLIISFD